MKLIEYKSSNIKEESIFFFLVFPLYAFDFTYLMCVCVPLSYSLQSITVNCIFKRLLTQLSEIVSSIQHNFLGLIRFSEFGFGYFKLAYYALRENANSTGL